MLRSFNFSIYLLIFIFIVYCKESKTGTGYIKQDKSMNAKAYVSYQEELDTKNFYTIVPLSEPVKVKVNVASLRFRKLPSLKAENIRPLLRGTELEMIGLGAIKFQADGKYDAWAQVRTEAGEIGYSFAGFLLEEDEDYNSEGTSDSGFVLLKSVPNLEKDLKTAVEIFDGYSDLKSTEELECEMDCQVYAYERVFEKDGRKYFLIKKQNKEYGINYMEHGSLEVGWVDSAYVQASGKNLYEYSRTKIKNKDIQMISEYLHSKDSIKSSFDISIAEKISTLDDSGIYYVVNYFDRDADFVPFERSSGVFFIQGKDIRMILNHFDSVVYQDINNDGVGEWLTTSSGRSDYSYILYGNVKGSMKNLIQVFESEYEGCSYSVMDGKQVSLKQAEEYSQKKCSLKIEDNGTVSIDHGLGILKFSFNGTKLIRI